MLEIINITKNCLKKLRYLIEFLLTITTLIIFRLLGLKRSSDYAGKLAIFIGKKLAVHKLANKNLAGAMPNLTPRQRDDILVKMWNNLGRMIGEYYYVTSAKLNDFIYRDKDNKSKNADLEVNFLDNSSQLLLSDLVAKTNNNSNNQKGAIIFSGHLGNWEVGPKFLEAFGLKVATVYRPLNNPWVESLVTKMRGGILIPKGVVGSRKIIEIIKKGGVVSILADQKISEGIAVPFFHRPAITTTAIARISLKYQVPIIPARVIRLATTKFAVEMKKSIEFDENTNLPENQDSCIFDITKKINQQLEEWIVEYPDQWFWVHNRWK